MSGSPALPMLEDVLVRHPRLRVYVTHAVWPMADEMVAILQACPIETVRTCVLSFGPPVRRKEA